MVKPVRHIITGHDAEGRAIFLEDDPKAERSSAHERQDIALRCPGAPKEERSQGSYDPSVGVRRRHLPI